MSARGVGRRIASAARRVVDFVDRDVHRTLGHMPLMAYTVATWGPARVERKRADGHAPLVFVHGYGGNRGNFLPMAAFFGVNGRTRSYRVGFELGQSLAERAAVLDGFVDEVLRVSGEDRVEVVAHSLGGLIARLAMARHGLGARMSTLVTLGTPHLGTHPARLGNSSVARDLRPSSPLMRELAELAVRGSTRVVCLWSASDIFVLPASSAVLPGAEAIEVSPFTHLSYLVDPASWRLVHDLLRPARRPAALGAPAS